LVSVTDLSVAARQQPLRKVAPRRFSPHLRRFAWQSWPSVIRHAGPLLWAVPL